MKKICLKSCVLQFLCKTHLIVFLFILITFTFINFYFCILLLIYLFLIRHYLSVSFLIIPFLLTILFSINFYKTLDEPSNIEGEFLVLDRGKNKLILKNKDLKYVVYNYTSSYVPGDVIYLSGVTSVIRPKLQDFSFSTSTYLKINNYSGILNIKSSKLVKHKFILNTLRYYIKSYYEQKIPPSYYDLFSTLVFADNNLSDDIRSGFSNLNMFHILAISGFHLMLLYKIVYFVLLYFTKRVILSEDISLVLLFVYSFLCNFTIPVTRAFLFLALVKFNERHNNYLSKLNIWSIVFLFQVFINPLSIFSLSFIFSYLASFFILFIYEFNTSTKPFFKNFIFSLLFFLLLFPFITQSNNKLSLFFLLSFLLTPFFTYFFIPINYLFLLFPFLSIYFNNIIFYLFNELNKLSSVFTIRIPHMNLFFTTIYYLMFLFVLYRKSLYKNTNIHLILPSISFFIFLLKPFILIPSITFLNVGQGDSTIVIKNGKVGLIDAFNSYDYLMKMGYYEIDSVLITHSDKDHLGDLDLIIKEWNVKNVYYSYYDTRFIDLGFKGTPLKMGDSFLFCNDLLTVISPKSNYKNVNDLSLCFYYPFYDKSILFTGDISKVAEDDLVRGSLLKKADILKVAHHGSITSSSLAFLELVRPTLSIISCGYKNRYDFPSLEVYNRLLKYGDVLVTYKNKNIKIYKNKVSYKYLTNT